MNTYKIILGEITGTFILVFLGTSSVAIAVLYNSLNLYQIAIVWTLAVTFGIYASQKLSGAHLNPAVSFGFLVKKDINPHQFRDYLTGQFTGAFLAGLLVYFIFKNDIVAFEKSHAILRATEASKLSAMMFGEFYPNPANSNLKSLSTLYAFLLEAGGTFILMSVILWLTNSKKNINKYIPFLIGITVGILIVFIAPYTQAGFNPARDFSPRLVSYFFGWKSVVFDLSQAGWLTVYILAPCLGAGLSAFLYSKFITCK